MKSKGEKIEIIQIIRLAASIAIIFYHSRIIGEHGFFGVDLFNVISGYVVMLSTEDIRSRKQFFRKRLIRVVPLYWALTILFYLIIAVIPQASLMSTARPEYLVKSLFFIPFVNDKGFAAPILGAGWTIQYEMFFYVIFWAAQWISHRYRALAAGALMCVMMAAAAFLPVPYILHYYGDPILLEFIMGMVGYYIVQAMQGHSGGRGKTDIMTALVAASAAWLLLDVGSEWPVPRSVRLGIPAMVVVVAALILWQGVSFPRVLVQLGNATYSVYLIEYFTTAAFKLVSANAAMPLKAAEFVIMTVLTLAVSYMSYLLVEVKFTRWLRRKLLKIR